MRLLRQLDPGIKVALSLVVLFCLGALPALWLTSTLGQFTDLSAIAAKKLSGADAAGFERARADAATLRVWTWVWLAASCGVAALLVRLMLGQVRGPLAAAVALAKRVAGGDLSGKIDGDSGHPLFAALHEMNGKLIGMIVKLRGSSEAIVNGAGSIANSGLDLSSRIEQQAASLEETASSMEELTATVKQNAEHAHQASRLAVSASEVAVKGGEVVSEVVGTMASINDSSKKIAEIIGVIDGIAFQTNILALNAAVEAARAGEQGRGFAVVASEVRNLAQRSAAAAKEIKVLIDDSVEKVSAGTMLVDRAGSTMNEVVTSVKRVTDIIGEIANASAEQTAGIEQVNHAITAMDQATQQNAALVEQSAAAAALVREQAGSLGRTVGAFVLGPQHARATPAVQLVAVNPKPVKARSDGPTRPRSAPLSAAPRPATAASAAAARRSAAAPQDVDWEEF